MGKPQWLASLLMCFALPSLWLQLAAALSIEMDTSAQCKHQTGHANGTSTLLLTQKQLHPDELMQYFVILGESADDQFGSSKDVSSTEEKNLVTARAHNSLSSHEDAEKFDTEVERSSETLEAAMVMPMAEWMWTQIEWCQRQGTSTHQNSEELPNLNWCPKLVEVEELRMPEQYVLEKKVSRKNKKMHIEPRYDSGSDEKLDGHCLYSALAYGWWKDGSLRHCQDLRNCILRAWRQTSQQALLAKVSAQEGCSTEQYLARFVCEGWGGLPEAAQFVRIAGISVSIWDAWGSRLAHIQGKRGHLHLQLDHHHYVLLRAKAVKQWSRCGHHADVALRGGGGRDILLKSRQEVEEERRQVVREEPPCRPPLPRWRPQERAEESLFVQQQLEANAEAQGLTSKSKPMTKPATTFASSSTSSGSLHPSGRRTPSPSASSSTRKTGAPKITTMASSVHAMPEDDSKEKDRVMQHKSSSKRKEAKMRDESHDKDRQAKKQKKKETVDKDEKNMVGKELEALPTPETSSAMSSVGATCEPQKGEIQMEYGAYCILCGKWSDAQHRNSLKHKTRLADHILLPEGLQKLHEKEYTKWAHEKLLTGGAKDDTVKDVKEEESSKGFPSSAKPADSDDVSDLSDLEFSKELRKHLKPSLLSDSPEEQQVSQEAAAAAVPESPQLAVLRPHPESDEPTEHLSEGSTLAPPSIEGGTPMYVDLGRRLAAVHVCPHTDMLDLMAKIAIEQRLQTRQVALVRAGSNAGLQ